MCITDDWAKKNYDLSHVKLFKSKGNILHKVQCQLLNIAGFFENCLRICFHITDILIMYKVKTGELWLNEHFRRLIEILHIALFLTGFIWNKVEYCYKKKMISSRESLL